MTWRGDADMTVSEKLIDDIIHTVLAAYPDTQAIYLFGPFGTDDEWPDSDVDIAVLLPPAQAKRVGSLTMSSRRAALQIT